MKHRYQSYQNDEDVTGINEIAYAFQKSKVLLTACELGIFNIIGDSEKSFKEVANEIEADERATDRLLNALCSLSYLNKQNNRFSNTLITKRFFVKGSQDYSGAMIHMLHLWDRWGTLTEAIKLGTSVKYDDISEKSEEWIDSYLTSMHWNAKLHAAELIEYINLNEVNRALDLGCGSGVYGIEFVRAKHDISVTCFDLPEIVPITQRYVDESGFSSSIKVVGGDFFKDDIGKEYDLVFLSNVLQNYTIWESLDLLKHMYSSLRIGGRLVVHERVSEEDRIHPTENALFSLNLLVNTKAGDTMTATDIWIIMKESWFADIERIDTSFNSSVIIGKK
ncbi:MAG: Acetylserotonin O-methyltransferase [Ignavibacteria bacterium]|nr:Acetylserotonin O-methyltransferase [Ignavibacteria bacterium]